MLGSYPNVNFRRVRMEEYTMEEQMAIAAETDVLISSHGMLMKVTVCELDGLGQYSWLG